MHAALQHTETLTLTHMIELAGKLEECVPWKFKQLENYTAIAAIDAVQVLPHWLAALVRIRLDQESETDEDYCNNDDTEHNDKQQQKRSNTSTQQSGCLIVETSVFRWLDQPRVPLLS